MNFIIYNKNRFGLVLLTDTGAKPRATSRRRKKAPRNTRELGKAGCGGPEETGCGINESLVCST